MKKATERNTEDKRRAEAQSRALSKLLRKKDFIGAYALFGTGNPFSWNYFYLDQEGNENKSLLWILFPKEVSSPAEKVWAKKILEKSLNFGFSPCQDMAFYDDFFTECSRSNFKAFCGVLEKHPREHEELLGVLLEVTAGWFSEHYEYVLTPELKHAKINNSPFLIELWRRHTTEYTLFPDVVPDLIKTTKWCLSMNYDAQSSLHGNLGDLIKKASQFAEPSCQEMILHEGLKLLAEHSKKDLLEQLSNEEYVLAKEKNSVRKL